MEGLYRQITAFAEPIFACLQRDIGEIETNGRPQRTEATLRGALSNSTLTDDEREQLEQEQAEAQAALELRAEDYQLAYAIDILHGLNALRPR